MFISRQEKQEMAASIKLLQEQVRDLKAKVAKMGKFPVVAPVVETPATSERKRWSAEARVAQSKRMTKVWTPERREEHSKRMKAALAKKKENA